MTILVIQGGRSAERDVSLRSGAAVVDALTARGHQVVTIDPASPDYDMASYVDHVDLAFPCLHGTGGEDGHIQDALDGLRIPYVGSGVAASRRCFDKDQFKRAVHALCVLVPAGDMVDHEGFLASPLRHRPFVLKPYDGGSSIDTFIIKDPDKLPANLSAVFDRHPRMLLEELITGTEITVSILGDTALPVIEIIPPQGQEFDYENKYNGKTAELCPPQSVTAEHQAQAQRIAQTIHRELGLRHLSRTDMIITPDGAIYTLETNTIPGLTTTSLFPKAAAAAGLTMPELVNKLVAMGHT